MKKNKIRHITIIPWAFAFIFLISCAHSEKQIKQEALPKLDLAIINPSSSAGNSGKVEEDISRAFVENLLVEKGLDRTDVHRMLCDSRVVIDSGFIMKCFVNSAPGASSSHSKYMYYNPLFIQKGRGFIEEKQDLFESIQEHYGISPEIITAILIIETKLGTYEGKYRAFDVYVNLALANDPEVISTLKDTYGKSHPGLYQDKTLEKVRAKGKWALEELYALILLSERLQIDPLEVKGSIAGALGPAQFIPSSFIRYGVSGSSNERIDPFCMDDAVASIANYLKLAGWTESISDKSEQKKHNAIWIYNHHEIYVNTVMKIYNELKLSGFNAKVTNQDYQK